MNHPEFLPMGKPEPGFPMPRNHRGPLSVLKRALTNPWWVGCHVISRIAPLIADDSTFLKWEYFFRMHRFPNLKNPTTFSEKLQWMKLNDRNPLYTRMVDKAESKHYVRQIMGSDQIIIPTYGVWDRFEDIDFQSLPKQFVLKTTHDSGGVVVVRDKATFDRAAAKQKLEASLRTSYYMQHREYPYRDVKPRILAEKYMEDPTSHDLKDYKFFCFNGEPRMLFIATDRGPDTRFDFYDTDLRHLPFAQGHPWADKPIPYPQNYEAMLSIARKLSAGLPQVRIDLYNINGQIYFGEITFFHFSGIIPFVPAHWDARIGSWWSLPTTP